ILETYPSCEIHICVVDIRNKQEIDDAIANLPSGFKDIDVLVNNAGTAFGYDPLEENSQKDIQTTIETNVYGLIYMTQAVLPRMKERNSGDIINMGSISGKGTHGKGDAIYAGSKFAVEGITE
ncbi:10626_t:CDS:2, partial [Racocetra persica]